MSGASDDFDIIFQQVLQSGGHGILDKNWCVKSEILFPSDKWTGVGHTVNSIPNIREAEYIIFLGLSAFSP